MKDYNNICLALAGVCQATMLVEQLAQTGKCDEAEFQTAIYSLLQTNPANPLAVYGGALENVKQGLSGLINELNATNPKQITIYNLSLLALEGKLNKNPEIKQQLGQRIHRLKEQFDYYNAFDDRIFAIIAGIYTDLISPLRRINIIGSPEHLQNTEVQHKIRACLLAGLRSAVLWRQFGGNKWQTLFSRRKLLNAAQQQYSSLNLSFTE